MKFTNNYNLNLPDLSDQYNLEDWNKNTLEIDTLIKERENEFNVHDSNLENPHKVKGSQLIEPVPTEKIADLSIITSKIADKNVTMEKLAQAIQQCLSPVGTIRTGLWTIAPDGWLLCDGSKVLISDYPNLYQCAVDNGWLKQDSDTTRFYLPNFKDSFPQGANGNLGTSIEAGLPNITGSVGNGSYRLFITQMVLKGAFFRKSSSTMSNWGNGDNSETKITQMDFDASLGETKLDGTLQNDVYGKSNTVQPKAFCVNYIIKY